MRNIVSYITKCPNCGAGLFMKKIDGFIQVEPETIFQGVCDKCGETFKSGGTGEKLISLSQNKCLESK